MGFNRKPSHSKAQVPTLSRDLSEKKDRLALLMRKREDASFALQALDRRKQAFRGVPPPELVGEIASTVKVIGELTAEIQSLEGDIKG